MRTPDLPDSVTHVASGPQIEVVHGDALSVESDVLVLKYARALYGVDAAVARALASHQPPRTIAPLPGESVVLETRGALNVPLVMFLGVVGLERLDYGQIRSFGRTSLEHLFDKVPDVRTVSMTLHGPGFGLDEREAFLALYSGLIDGMRSGALPPLLRRIAIVEFNSGRAHRLRAFLDGISQTPDRSRGRDSFPEAGESSMKKPHVFVAMPFSEGEMEDVFGFGIQGPVHAAGLLCERVDLAVFTGDVLQRVWDRIDTSRLVIADLTGANPNVYLEVGYAWGRKRPTLLLARTGTDLKFDVRGHRCVMYRNITELSARLKNDLPELLAG